MAYRRSQIASSHRLIRRHYRLYSIQQPGIIRFQSGHSSPELAVILSRIGAEAERGLTETCSPFLVDCLACLPARPHVVQMHGHLQSGSRPSKRLDRTGRQRRPAKSGSTTRQMSPNNHTNNQLNSAKLVHFYVRGNESIMD